MKWKEKIKTKTMSDYSHKYKEIENGCWEWQAHLNKGGYGTQVVGSRVDGTRKSTLAHRLFYKLAYGKYNENLCVLHTCDNPKCVNPAHLFLGTRADNHADMLRKGRRVDLRGEARPNAKLSEKDVKHIKTMLKNGIYQKNIAELYNVNQTLISAIKTGKVWNHL